jgi:hypothetical protein
MRTVITPQIALDLDPKIFPTNLLIIKKEQPHKIIN